jgi:HAD superfamily hydrolase (TIGR01509 family)
MIPASRLGRDRTAQTQPSAALMPRLDEYVGFVFDFDGTLVDSDELNCAAMCAALAAAGVQVDLAWARAEPFISMQRLRSRLRTELSLGLAVTDDQFVATASAYYLAHRDQLTALATTLPLVHAARGCGPLAVASANYSQVVRAGLETTGLAGYFSVIVGRDDVSEAKPAPEAFLLAADRLGTPARRCMAFENTDAGVAAAMAAGMAVIDVRIDPRIVRMP